MRKFVSLLGCLAILSACQLSESVAQTKASYEASSGSFHAILMPVAEADLVEFDKPENGGPSIQFQNTAVCGDKVALKIVFSGMGLTDENVIDVTYDIEVLSPDNTPYSGAVHKDVPAFQGVVQRPNNIYNNLGVLVLRFEPKDQVGDYQITTVVRDNIGKHEVTLKSSIELQPCR